MTDRLNIILLFSDQQRADSLPCYGNSFVQTPYLDRMAQEGTVFTQCRTVVPGLHARARVYVDGSLPAQPRDRT